MKCRKVLSGLFSLLLGLSISASQTPPAIQSSNQAALAKSAVGIFAAFSIYKLGSIIWQYHKVNKKPNLPKESPAIGHTVLVENQVPKSYYQDAYRSQELANKKMLRDQLAIAASQAKTIINSWNDGISPHALNELIKRNSLIIAQLANKTDERSFLSSQITSQEREWQDEIEQLDNFIAQMKRTIDYVIAPQVTRELRRASGMSSPIMSDISSDDESDSEDDIFYDFDETK